MIDFPGAVVMDRAGFVGANMPEDYGSAKQYTRNIHAVPAGQTHLSSVIQDGDLSSRKFALNLH